MQPHDDLTKFEHDLRCPISHTQREIKCAEETCARLAILAKHLSTSLFVIMPGCRHPDIQRFGEIRCCLSCGDAVFDDSAPGLPVKSLELLSSQYQYKPLRQGLGHEIRLLILFAGEPSDDLFCDITTVNLIDRPSYEAVSYTWANPKGDVSLTSEIRCRGSKIAITKNCEAALRRLRLQGRNRRLWVDAICIDQNDTSEKNHQVRLMSTIYSNAAQVLSYLGVTQISNKLRVVIDFLQGNTGSAAFESGPPHSRKELLSSFLDLPYFDRVWVMQEVGLAQLVTLIIGEYEIHWTGDTILRTLEICSSLSVVPPSVLRWTPSSRPEENNDILEVLARSRNCSASDPRDKVFALLGLMDAKIASEFPVDYSVTHHEVYAKLAHYCINKLGRFDILQHCQHVADDLGQVRVPTWIPQWDFRNVFEPLPAQFTTSEKQNFASAWHMAPTSPGAWLRNELPLQLLPERITADFASDTDLFAADMNLSTATCRVQVRKRSEIQSVYKPESTLSAADDEHLAQLIVHRQSSNFSFKVLNREYHGNHPELNRIAQRFPDSVIPIPLKMPCLKLRAHRLDSIARRIGPIIKHRITTIPQTAWSALGVPFCEFCTTPAESDRGYRASFWQQRKDMVTNMDILGPGMTAFATIHSVGFTHGKFVEGDSIWALYGADVPFILREIDGHHELVGDCYLHRAGQLFLCEHCGAEVAPWPMRTEIVDIW
jgi:hypothetical protein